MHRSKQQALMFLLGALLVGAILGSSADRFFGEDRPETPTARRQAMYDDLQLTPTQRATMDSLLDQRHCQMSKTLATVQPRLDSIRASARVQIDRLLTPDQRQRLEARRARIRKDGEKEKRDEARRLEACK